MTMLGARTLVILALLWAGCCNAFISGFGGRVRSSTKFNVLVASSTSSGVHGQGFRFLPQIRTGRTEHYPRILPVAGVYPGVTVEELLAPVPLPAAPQGTWTYDFSELTGGGGGKVAIPGSIVITEAVDPVVLVSTNTALCIQSKVEVESLIIVDRKDPAPFDPDCFYLFRTMNNELKVLWCNSPPEDMEIMGKIVSVALPYVKANSKAQTGFAEEDDDEDD